MFAYCGNNPVNRDDPNGQFWGALLAGIGAVFAIPVEVAAVITVGVAILAAVTIHAVVDLAVKEYKNHHVSYSDSTDKDAKKDRNKPKQKGEPNSREVARNKNGDVEKYTEFDSEGNFKKEVRLTGKEHGPIPRPNVKEPKFNVNPKTGQEFQNGYRVRPATSEEINIEWDVK